jgi:hypothetical protein
MNPENFLKDSKGALRLDKIQFSFPFSAIRNKKPPMKIGGLHIPTEFLLTFPAWFLYLIEFYFTAFLG